MEKLDLAKYYFCSGVTVLRKLGFRDGWPMLYGWIVHKLRPSYRTTDTWVFHSQEYNLDIYYRPFSSDCNLLWDFFVFGTNSDYSTGHYFYREMEGQNVEYIIDAGANIGLFSALYGEKYPDAKIIAVEPDADSYRVLKMNTAFDKNITCIQGGLWSRSTELAIENPDSDKWAIQVREQIGGAIQAYSVRDLMQKNNFPRLDVMKMDIEGSEYPVFQAEDAEGWIQQTKHIFCETHAFEGKTYDQVTNSIKEKLRCAGFSHRQVGEDHVFHKL